MQSISMDLIEEFYPKSSAGNSYALTVIHMLTGYTLYNQIKSKSASDVIRAYTDHGNAKFGGSVKMLSGSRTELKNELLFTMAEQLREGYEIYTVHYHP